MLASQEGLCHSNRKIWRCLVQVLGIEEGGSESNIGVVGVGLGRQEKAALWTVLIDTKQSCKLTSPFTKSNSVSTI
jgi:hypothetical protein